MLQYRGVTTGDQSLDIIFYVIIWLALFFRIYALLWVAKDISMRSDHLWLQVLCILLILLLTPIFGLPIYFLIRPVQSDYYDADLAYAMMVDSIQCLQCHHRNPKEFEFCAYCGSKLKYPCKECKKAYAIDYDYCPFCGAPNLEWRV
jgi:hypothetical protein